MKKLRRFDPGQEGMRSGDVWINARSRDDIPKLLGVLRDVYLNVELREAVFRLLEPGLFTKIDERTRVVLLTHCPIYSNSSSLRRWGEMPWVNRVLTGFRLVTTGRLKLTAATRV